MASALTTTHLRVRCALGTKSPKPSGMNTPMQTIDGGIVVWFNGHMEQTTYTPIDGHRPLSPRMVDVLTMHDTGMTNVAIADALGIAPGTVSNALNDALRRTGRRSDASMADVGMDIDTYAQHRIAAIDASIDEHVAAIDAMRDERNRITAIMGIDA